MPNDETPDEYELLPHKEIEDLKDELAKLKEFEVTPSKRLQVSLLELNTKLDKLIMIFEDATHQLRVEEGGLSFTDKMRPVLEKMNKILEQNAEIASGILALADMVKEKETEQPELPRLGMPELPPMPPQRETQFPPIPPMPPRREMTEQAPPGLPLPPLPRRRTFGI